MYIVMRIVQVACNQVRLQAGSFRVERARLVKCHGDNKPLFNLWRMLRPLSRIFLLGGGPIRNPRRSAGSFGGETNRISNGDEGNHGIGPSLYRPYGNYREKCSLLHLSAA